MTSSLMSEHVAMVTGATRGIGAAIALEFAQKGMRVIGTATSEAGAHRISEALSSYAGSKGVVLDVNDKLAGEALIDGVVKEHGALHVLVNNAGITKDMLAMRLKDDDWDQVIQTNLSSVFRLCRAAIRPMMKQRYGRIINITSVVGASGNPGQSNYAAAKAGLAGMSRALARELGSRHITVNCVAPGFIQTDMTAALSEAQNPGLDGANSTGPTGAGSRCGLCGEFFGKPPSGLHHGTRVACQWRHVNALGLHLPKSPDLDICPWFSSKIDSSFTTL